MSTFSDPFVDAAEAAEALRGLAHASRVFENPADMYEVLGNVLSGVRSLEQVLGQLATNHAEDGGRAFDDHGDREAGLLDARTAATELRQAATLIGQAEERLNVGMSAAGRISWHSTSEAEVSQRWINVVFLQGNEADRLLNLIQQGGTDEVIQQLAGYDYGDETLDAALENGYVYNEPPIGQFDRTTTLDVYTLVYNPFLGHLGLYRQEDALPAPVLIGISDPLPAAQSTTVAEPVPSVGPVQPRSRADRLGNPDFSDDDIVLTQRGLTR